MTSQSIRCLALVAACGVGIAAQEPVEATAGPADTRQAPTRQASTGPAADDTPALRVATFNIRYGTARDGDNAWPKRRENVVTTIRDWQAHVVGIQEALHFQVEHLREQLPDMGFVGQGRDGGTTGEYAGILYDTARLELARHGDFWLSETPDVVASVGWDAALTRMVTWAVFRDRPTNTWFRVWNTHFDHRGRDARTESGRLIARRVLRSPLPDIVLGDLNAGEDSDALDALRDAGLRDTWRELHPEVLDAGTFGGFRGVVTGKKIDYVLADDGFITTAAAIDRRNFDGRDPSDHFPVTAELTFAVTGPRALAPVAMVQDSITIAAGPELGVLATDAARLAGHAAWRTADGDWRLWARVTGTAVGDVLHGWRGESLRRQLWQPEGVALRASRQAGEHRSGAEFLGAPAAFGLGRGVGLLVPTARPGRAGHALSLLTSDDGLTFSRHEDARGYSEVHTAPTTIRKPAALHGSRGLVCTWLDADGTASIAIRNGDDVAELPFGDGLAGPADDLQIVARDGSWYWFVTPADDAADRTLVYRTAPQPPMRDAQKVAELPWPGVRVFDDGGETFATWCDGRRIFAAPLHWRAAAD